MIISRFIFINLAFHLIAVRFADPAKLSATGRQTLTDEERLNDIIFHNYDPSFRPVWNASEPVEIIFGLNLINISNLDEINQVLVLAVWLEMYWKDKRLSWSPADFSGLEMVRLPTKMLWTPDIVLYNSADEFRLSGDVRAMVANTGEIFAGPYVKLRSTCILDLTLYPFDDQLCKLIFGSWSYDMSQLNVVSNSRVPVLTQYVESAVWVLLDSEIVETRHSHSCCPYPFSDIVVSIRMRRRFLFNNLLNIFIPTMWLTLLTLLTFWLDPASGEKITLCITILVTFTLFQLLVAENTPRTSDFVPLISLYLTTSYISTAFVVGIQVFILNINGLSPILVNVPHPIRVIVLNGIATILCLDTSLENDFLKKFKSDKKASKKRKQAKESVNSNYFDQNGAISSQPLPNSLMPLIGDEEILEEDVYWKTTRNGPAAYKDPGSDTSSLEMKLNDETSEHIYYGIEEILDMLSPKTQQRFLQRDLNVSYCHSRSRTTSPAAVPVQPDDPIVITDDDSDDEREEVADRFQARSDSPIFARSTNVQFSVKAPPPSPLVASKSFADGNYQQLREAVRQQRQNDERSALYSKINKSALRKNKSSSIYSSTSSKKQLPSNVLSGRSRLEKEILTKLLRAVGFMIQREESAKTDDLLIAEWRMVAFVLDRLSFWLFALFTVTFIMLYLVILPLSEHFRHRHNTTLLARTAEMAERMTAEKIINQPDLFF